MGTIKIESNCGQHNVVSERNLKTGEVRHITVLKPPKSKHGNTHSWGKIAEQIETCSQGGDTIIQIQAVGPEKAEEIFKKIVEDHEKMKKAIKEMG